MSFGSDRADSTQEFSQRFIEEHISPSKSRQIKFREADDRLAQFNSAETQRTTPSNDGERTYVTNGTGHIELGSQAGGDGVNLEEEAEDDDMVELLEEDMAPDTQTFAIASQFPEDRRFKTPKTPASRGKKRTRNGDILSDPGSTPRSTPRLPVNPFGGKQAVNPAPMTLSQVFNATQAPSSPMLNVPTSDGSERPSPNMENIGRPASAPLSSPTKLFDTPEAFPTSGPYERYESLNDSQQRRKRESPPDLTSDAQMMPDDDSSDLIDQFSPDERGDGMGPVRRDKAPMSAAIRRTLQGITARRRSPQGSGRGVVRPGRTARQRQAEEPRPHTSPAVERTTPKSALPVSKLNLRYERIDTINGTPDEKVAQDNNGQQEEFEPRELEESEERQVQVPRTISKCRQIMVPEPAPSHPASCSPLEEQRLALDTIDVVNSQYVHGTVKAAPHESSNDPTVPQSQVPDSTATFQPTNTQPTLPQVKALAAVPLSQQTATPPSSSPSPERPASSAKLFGRSFPAVSKEKGVERLDTDQRSLSGDELTSPDMTAPPDSPNLPATVQETHSADERGAEPELSPERQSVSAATKKTQLRRPKKLSAILSQQSAPDMGLGNDIFDAFNEIAEDHSRFQAAIGTTPESSPAASDRRRGRRPLAPSREVPTLNAARDSSSAAGSSQPETGRPAFHSARAVREETPATRPRESPVTTPGQSSSEKENEPTPRRKRLAVDPVPDVEANHSRTSQQAPPSSTISEPVVPPGRKRARTGPLLQRRQEIDEVSVDSGMDDQGPATPAEQAPFPSMVWALFTGSPHGYFPARCLGPAENNKFRVRFEDGNERSVPINSVRRLEVRIGDTVKIDNPKAKMNSYVVQELAEKQQWAPPPTQIQTLADIYGWTKVRLALKTKNGPVEPQKELVSYSLLYLTQTLFNSLKDRVYQHVLEEGSIRTQTPSISQSMPATPTSKQLRASTMVKKESGLRQSSKTSKHQHGLFSEMTFAVTSVEQKKRLDLQSVIERNGGGLLLEGFEEIFDGPHKTPKKSTDSETVPLQLDSSSKTYGFTALLTDRHCRTKTYLNALALNIPCLSVCWIRDCVAKGQLLDWRHYLLPSGESLVLDSHVRSRVMEVPTSYSSAASIVQWPLASMFAARKKIMEGATVLICSYGPSERQMKGHAFIAHAMGASRVALASSANEAEKYRRESNWDWIFSADVAEAQSEQKGRKRKSGVGDNPGDLEVQWKDGSRVVKAEFVVQSLVLGRLVSE